jgi:hypothetical protein
VRRRDALRLMAGAALVAALPRDAPAALRPRVAVLAPAGEPWAREATSRALATAGVGGVLDPSLVDAAARGASHDGSLNLTLEDARRLALVTGADALVLSYASIVERESDKPERRHDGFVGLFLVDGRTGRLVRYRGVAAFAESATSARGRIEAAVAQEVGGWGGPLAVLGDPERVEPVRPAVELDLVASPDPPPGGIPPRFFRRPVPKFTDEADRAHVVATVDLVIHFNADATYGPIEVVRWAGFGLDESAVEAVRSVTFYPARLGGRPVSARALLRFNFRFRER